MCFHPTWVLGVWGGGGGLVSQWTGTQIADAVFHPGQLKIEVSETCFFFDIVTTHNDHSSYVKHSLGGSYLFFTLFGYWVWGGASPKGVVHHLLVQIFTLGRSKLEVLVFLIW